MRIVAISVDTVAESNEWKAKKGWDQPAPGTFTFASDAPMTLIDRFGIRNRKQPDLALHAVYIVDAERKVLYRKVARRRAYSNELLDAVDHHRGLWRPPSKSKPAAKK